MKNSIRFFDFYGPKVTLKIKGDYNRHKTILGGTLSIITIMACLGLSAVFLSEFIARSSPTIISNMEQSNAIELEIYKIPYMIRITDSFQRTHPQKEKYWGIKFYIWNSKYNETDPNPNKLPIKSYKEIPMEVCDINKHYGIYKDYFKDYNDLSTFLCPNFQGYEANATLVGKYGEITPNSYYMYYVYYCVNGVNNKTNCENKETVKNYLANSYLDVRTLDYSINSMQTDVNSLFVRNDRHSASSSVYKRIWQFMQTVEYRTDFGLIFNETTLDTFFQIEQIRYESDLRDLDTGSTVNGTFVVLNLLNSPVKAKYYRTFAKLQTLIANIGGVINGIMKLAKIIGLFFLLKLYELKLVNTIVGSMPPNKPMQIPTNNKETIFRSFSNNQPVLVTEREVPSSKTNHSFSIIPQTQKSIDKCYEMAEKFENVYKMAQMKGTRLKMRFSDLYLSKCCLKEKDNRRIFDKAKQMIIKQINIVNIIHHLNDFDKLKDILLDENQKKLFHLIPLKNAGMNRNISKRSVIQSVENTILSKRKIDSRLLSHFELEKK